jgi:hypothetical protein
MSTLLMSGALSRIEQAVVAAIVGAIVKELQAKPPADVPAAAQQYSAESRKSA